MEEIKDDFKRFLVFLTMFDNTNLKNEQILNSMDNDYSLKHFTKMKFDSKILPPDIHDKMKVRADEKRINNYYTNLLNDDITLLTKYDSNYPIKLKDLPDSPLFLFCKGDISLFNLPSLTVVGTRKPTAYGRMVTEKLVRDVAEQGIVIVSGLAYGVDSISHRKCLDVGGKTIAVLGSGFNEIYPAEHTALAQEISRKGLIISEYAPNKKATKYSFPQRNRILAGLGDGILITEAGFKSGTKHTKDFALDYGRNIYSVPGNIDSYSSELTNDIIKSGQAQCVTCAKDILDDYQLDNKKEEKEVRYQLSMEEQAIVSLLEDGMKDIEYLTKNCNLAINIFNSNLTMLEIRGIIKRLPGGLISLN